MRPSIRTTGKTLRALILVLLALGMAACGEHDIAIFYFIENEEEEIDNSLPNEITALGMGKRDEVALVVDMNGDLDMLDSWYYVSAGLSIWSRDTGGTEWSKIAMPPGQSYVGSIVDFPADTSLSAGTLGGLYTGGPSSWIAVADTDVAGKQVMDLWTFPGAPLAPWPWRNGTIHPVRPHSGPCDQRQSRRLHNKPPPT